MRGLFTLSHFPYLFHQYGLLSYLLSISPLLRLWSIS
nr:MAG TPA: hypothetical protein [Caudoviricetes sp.]